MPDLNISGSNESDAMEVRWHLLDVCNLSCSNCHFGKNKNTSAIFSRERLFAIVDNLSDANAGFYHITFCGPDPLLHPLLADIISYMAAKFTAFGITVETNVHAGLEAYAGVLNKSIISLLNFKINIPFAYPDPHKLFMLLAGIGKSARSLQIFLGDKPINQENHIRLKSGLKKLQEAIGFEIFTLSETPCVTTAFHRTADAGAANLWPLKDCGRGGEQNPQIVHKSAESVNCHKYNIQGAYGCPGLHYVEICPDGTFYGAPGGQASSGAFLWEDRQEALYLGAPVLKLKGAVSVRQFEYCPVFGTYEEALEYYGRIKAKRSRLAARPEMAGSQTADAVPQGSGSDRQEPAAPRMAELWTRPAIYSRKISFIILCQAPKEQKLRESLDSIAAQISDDCEILLIENSCREETKEIIAEYVSRFPHLIRRLSFQKPVSGAIAKNMGLISSHGEYCVFLGGEEILGSMSACAIRQIISEAYPDILAIKDSDFHGKMNHSEILSQMESLPVWLHCAGRLSPVTGLVINRKFINEKGIIFKGNFGLEDIEFLGEALLDSNKTILADLGYPLFAVDGQRISSRNDAKAGEFFVQLSEMTARLRKLLNRHGLLSADDICGQLEADIFALYAGLFVKWMEDSNGKNFSDFANIREFVLSSGKSGRFVYAILEKYVSLWKKEKGVSLLVNENDIDWKLYNTDVASCPLYEAYGPADRAKGAVKISIIVPNYNKSAHLEACLKSILGQNWTKMEIIVVDDASTDNSWDILRELANNNAQIRLYRMLGNSRQGVCRNVGIEKARGEFIVFVDSDDLLMPDFLSRGVPLCERENADMAIFSHQRVNLDGNITYSQKLENKIIGSGECMELYALGKIQAAPWAKIFRRDFLRASGCFFEENIYHQDQYFFTDICQQAPRIILSSLIAYTVVDSINSTIRPKNVSYLHVHSVCRLFSHWHELCKKFSHHLVNLACIHGVWNLENIALQAWDAYYSTTGTIALQADDLAILQGNPIFLLSLLTGYAKRLERRPFTQPQVSSRKDSAFASEPPLISVIIPTYNQEKLIGRCLDSILAQNISQLEIIIIDDASTDCTKKVCEAYSDKDGRIRLLANPFNKGQGYSRNYGLMHARGEYIAFVDSDDYILVGYFLHAIAHLKHNPELDLVHFYLLYGDKKVPMYKFGDKPQIETGLTMFREYCNGGRAIYTPCTQIYRASFLKENNIKFPEYMYEDNLFLMQVFSKAANILLEPLPAYVYTETVHTASAKHPQNYSRRHMKGLLNACAGFGEFFRANKNIDPDGTLAGRRIPRMFNYFKKEFLQYISTRFKSGINPVETEDVNCIARTPQLFRAILENYAEKTVKTDNYFIENMETSSPDSQKYLCGDMLIPVVKNYLPSQELCIFVIFDNEIKDNINSLEKIIKNIVDCDTEIVIIDNFSGSAELLLYCMDLCHAHDKVSFYQTCRSLSLMELAKKTISLTSAGHVTYLKAGDVPAANFVADILENLAGNGAEIVSFSGWNVGSASFRELQSFGRCRPGMAVIHELVAKDRFGPIHFRGTIYDRVFLSDEFCQSGALSLYEYPFLFNLFLHCQNYLQIPGHGVNMAPQKDMEATPVSIGRINAAGKAIMAFDSCGKAQSLEKRVMEALFAVIIKKDVGFIGDFWGFIMNCREHEKFAVHADKTLERIAASDSFMEAFIRCYAGILA